MLLAQHGMMGYIRNPLNPDGGLDYYVSENGTGNGLHPAFPMSPADFELIILAQFDRAFFLDGDEF